MTCAIRARISITSPLRAPAGRLMMTRAMPVHVPSMQAASVTTTSAVSIQHAAVAHPRQGDELLAGGQPHPRADHRLARARAEAEHGNVALRVAVVEDADAHHVIGRAHRAVDLHRDGHQVAVVDQRFRSAASPGRAAPAFLARSRRLPVRGGRVGCADEGRNVSSSDDAASRVLRSIMVHSLTQGREVGDHVLDLLRREDGLALPGGADA